MLKTLTAAALIALAATGCQSELALLPHASADTAPVVCTPLPWFCEKPNAVHPRSFVDPRTVTFMVGYDF